MDAEKLVRDGKLDAALQDLKAHVRKQPENSRYRTFLFQLFAVLGDWERAVNQLNVLSDLDPATLPMLHVYREAIQCEILRKEIFAGRRKPLLLGEPPAWVATLLESLRLLGEGRHDLAITLRDQAFEEAPASSGNIDGKPFQWIADADSRQGPILEVILNSKYYWAPFQQIGAVKIGEPTDLRDKVWLPAQFTWKNGGQAHGLIPARYVGSENSRDPMIQLGRKTEWITPAEGMLQGLGQKMLATDLDEYALLDIRQITIN